MRDPLSAECDQQHRHAEADTVGEREDDRLDRTWLFAARIVIVASTGPAHGTKTSPRLSPSTKPLDG